MALNIIDTRYVTGVGSAPLSNGAAIAHDSAWDPELPASISCRAPAEGREAGQPPERGPANQPSEPTPIPTAVACAARSDAGLTGARANAQASPYLRRSLVAK
jgi:hypothetical protein